MPISITGFRFVWQYSASTQQHHTPSAQTKRIPSIHFEALCFIDSWRSFVTAEVERQTASNTLCSNELFGFVACSGEDYESERVVGSIFLIYGTGYGCWNSKRVSSNKGERWKKEEQGRDRNVASIGMFHVYYRNLLGWLWISQFRRG